MIEPLALDEAYLDVTQEGRTLAQAEEIARSIQADILAETELTCSAGVAVNKFLAKPAGLTVIPPEEVDALLAALPVEEFYGVGPVIAGKLQAQGIHTGADLRARSLLELQAILGAGKLAPRLYDLALGVNERPVEAHREPKSIGVEETFERDVTTREELLSLRSRVTTGAAEQFAEMGAHPARKGMRQDWRKQSFTHHPVFLKPGRRGKSPCCRNFHAHRECLTPSSLGPRPRAKAGHWAPLFVRVDKFGKVPVLLERREDGCFTA